MFVVNHDDGYNNGRGLARNDQIKSNQIKSMLEVVSIALQLFLQLEEGQQ